MAGIREYNFDSGIETSQIPSGGDPSATGELITLGYADEHYTPRSHVYGKVTDIDELKTIESSMRFNEQIAWVAGLDVWYEFDSASVATPDDDLVVEPDVGTGRWEKIEGGSSSGAGAAGLDVLIQKVENEKTRGITTPIDNSAYRSGAIIPDDQNIEGNLLSDFTGGGSVVDVVWNAIAVSDSDKNFDATTGWSGNLAGTNLTTSATKKIGTASLSFDKDGSGTYAGIQYDRGSQNLNLSANTRAWFWVNMPSVTNLTSINLRIYADSTSNYRQWALTTNYAGSAIATGWNLMFADISSTAGSTAGGTGWLYTQLSRYVEISVITSSGGQTYTPILVDSLYFSLGRIAKVGTIGNEFNMFNNSVNTPAIIDSANTRHDGPLTLSAAFATSVVGGTSGAARARIKRSNMTISAPGLIGMDNDSGLSGASTTSQYLRFGTMIRESLSGAYKLYVDQTATQLYEVTAVGGSTIDVLDPSNQSANLLNTEIMDIFRPQYFAGETTYRLIKTIAMTSNGSHSSGTTTLTLNTTDIAVGDLACKRHVSEVAISVVEDGDNETFSAQTVDALPDGAILMQQFVYPNEANIYAHFTLGDVSSAEATRNRKGPTGYSLSVTGSPVFASPFFKGRFAADGFSGSNYYKFSPGSAVQSISGDAGDATSVQHSFWFYDEVGFTGNSRVIAAILDGAGSTGWRFILNSGANTLRVSADSNTDSSTYTTGQWNHVVINITDSSTFYIYINGVLSGSGANTIGATTYSDFWIGRGFSATDNVTAEGVRLTDWIIWRNAPALTLAQINYLYNAGSYMNTLGPNAVRLMYTANGQSGQKVSMRIKDTRSTTAIAQSIMGAGLIKS